MSKNIAPQNPQNPQRFPRPIKYFPRPIDTPEPSVNLQGKRIHMLQVICQAPDIKYKSQPNGHRAWWVVCDCGVHKRYPHGVLMAGKTKSCGCWRTKWGGQISRTHGLSGKKGGKYYYEYRVWKGMLQRCYRKDALGYKNYGGRGIKVCKRWHDFENFIEDMGKRPGNDEVGKLLRYTLDRIDNEGNYTPKNCHWATWKQQGRNRRNNRIIEYKGLKKCVSEWSEELGLSTNIISNRLKKGWSIEKTFETPYEPYRLGELEQNNRKEYATWYIIKSKDICDEWKDFKVFLNDMGKSPKQHRITKKDKDKEYSPDNCYWRRFFSMDNKVTYKDKRKTLREWARKFKLKPRILRNRMKKILRKKDIGLDRAFRKALKVKRCDKFIEYKGKVQNMAQWGREYDIDPGRLSTRINKYGWSVEKALTKPLVIGREKGNPIKRDENGYPVTAKPLDLTDKRFGKLTALEILPWEPGKERRWKCRCDCGKIVVRNRSTLTQGHEYISCGCTRKPHKNRSCKQVDYSGQKFNRLTILHIDPDTSHLAPSRRKWICRCDCGNETSVLINALKNGGTKSCGCLRYDSYVSYET